MENLTSTHQGPIARASRGTGGKKESNEDIEAKRRRWRDAYYASKAKKRKQLKGGSDEQLERKRAASRAYYHRTKKKKARVKVKEVRGGKDNPGPVPKTGNRTDALIYLNKALRALSDKDYEGTELFARLCRRVLQGKE